MSVLQKKVPNHSAPYGGCYKVLINSHPWTTHKPKIKNALSAVKNFSWVKAFLFRPLTSLSVKTSWFYYILQMAHFSCKYTYRNYFSSFLIKFYSNVPPVFFVSKLSLWEAIIILKQIYRSITKVYVKLDFLLQSQLVKHNRLRHVVGNFCPIIVFAQIYCFQARELNMLTYKTLLGKKRDFLCSYK